MMLPMLLLMMMILTMMPLLMLMLMLMLEADADAEAYVEGLCLARYSSLGILKESWQHNMAPQVPAGASSLC